MADPRGFKEKIEFVRRRTGGDAGDDRKRTVVRPMGSTMLACAPRRSTMPLHRRLVGLGRLLATVATAAAAQAQPVPPAARCQAVSAATPPTVLELYTSEGCSSCPPADRWLSSLLGRADVLALAFHVSYWDRLGWPDRFALPEATARQRELAQRAGSRQVYTPQVVANGRDWRDWHREPIPRPAVASGAAVKLRLQQEGPVVRVQVDPWSGGAGARLSGYWALLEDFHESQVKAGENAGATLRHHHVVRMIQPVPPWLASAGHAGRIEVPAEDPRHPKRVVFVVNDETTSRPVQALALACPPATMSR